MQRWREQATERLRDGETIEESISFGDNGVVVTNQRLLAFVPESEGANFRAIERPNVEGATLHGIGNADWLEYMGKGGLAGVVGIIVGTKMEFSGFISLQGIDPKAASQTGVGSMLGMLSQISTLVGKIDDAMLVVGLLGVAVWLGALGMYIESREYVLDVTVAGDSDLQVPAPKDADAEHRQLERLLRTTTDDERSVDDETGPTYGPHEDPDTADDRDTSRDEPLSPQPE